MRYTHIFWDLDHTLWDFERNSRIALKQLFQESSLSERADHAVSFDEFYSVYKRFNEWVWDRYRHGLMTKEELRQTRFRRALGHFGLEDRRLAKWFEDEYVKRSPHQPHLMPGASDLLEWLRGKVEMWIITNGFSEVQTIKMEASGLDPYFSGMITSEAAGVRKPNAHIFQYAFRKSGAEAQNSLMIGDNWDADIRGAAEIGMDQVFFAPELGSDPAEGPHLSVFQPTYRVSHLSEIKAILSKGAAYGAC